MDNTSLGEMELEQIPKDFQPNKNEYKSPWAFILIVLIIIIFSIFWFVESKKETTPPPVISTEESPRKESPSELTSDLEASIGSINIPDYSSSL
jgi:hypothetical protein